MGKLYALICGLWGSIITIGAQEVVFVVPFQDLFPEKLSTYGTEQLYDYYNNYQSWSGLETKYDCIRTAQVPFNTKGTLLEYDATTGEACIQFDHMVVDVGGMLQPCKFWTLDYRLDKHESKNTFIKKPTFIVLDKKNSKKYGALFPPKVDADDVATLRAKNTLVLKYPWVDPFTDTVYSAGTRFVRNPKQDTDDEFAIVLFDGTRGGVEKSAVSKKLARPCDEILSDDERREFFNEILRAWCCRQHDTIIPYVWGGGVIMLPVENTGFEIVDDYFFQKPVTYYVRPDVGVPAGVDCSSLVLLAAQVAGIDCFYKTTHTFFKRGHVIKNFADIQPGDLVVWQGHMVIVSTMDKDHATCIESLGYGDGAGRVREVALGRKFKDIDTYQDLWRACKLCKNKKPLEIFYAHNDLVAKTIPEFKIVSLFGETKGRTYKK